MFERGTAEYPEVTAQSAAQIESISGCALRVRAGWVLGYPPEAQSSGLQVV
jgi:hypothetical protein